MPAAFDRLFLDANILVSAALRPDSQLLRIWRLARVALLTSSYAVDEAQRNLSGPALKELSRLLQAVEVLATAPDSSLPSGVDLPEKDRPILHAAIASGATHLITGDRKHFGRYFGGRVAGVLIETPAAYLARR